MQKAVEKEFEMALQDRVMEETKHKKNVVESSVYEMRNKLYDKYQDFKAQSDREQFIAKLQEVEDCLYEDGEDETKGVYITKLKELKKNKDIGDGVPKAFSRTSQGNIGVTLLWHILHWVLSIWFFIVTIAEMLESYLISNRYPESYSTLNIQKVKYLAVAIDSEEAKQTKSVLRLLEWLTSIGVKNVCLYDSEGVLKKSKDTIKELLNCNCLEDNVVRDSFSHQHIELDFASFHDGKESVVKAANFLFEKYYLDPNQAKPNLAELNMAEALEAIGCGGPDPDLLLIYGPTRAHMGFPAWRIRYTELVHMGSLNSMKFGLLINAIHKFTMVRQNYGT